MDNIQQLCDRYRPWIQASFERYALGDHFDWELIFTMLTAMGPLGQPVQQPGFILYVQTPSRTLGQMHYKPLPIPTTVIPGEEEVDMMISSIVEELRALRSAEVNGGVRSSGLIVP